MADREGGREGGREGERERRRRRRRKTDLAAAEDRSSHRSSWKTDLAALAACIWEHHHVCVDVSY